MEHSKANIAWLEDIKKEAEEIMGNWNGKESGLAEDRAGSAEEIIEGCNRLIELINYLDEN